MAITSVHEKIDAREATVDLLGQRQYKRVWRVTTDDKTVGALEVLFSPNIPRQWDKYITQSEHDFGARVVRVTPRQTSDPTTWEVHVEYDSGRISPEQARQNQSPAAAHQSNQQDDNNPFTKPAEISWGFSQHQRFDNYDTTGRAYVNSAGMLLDHVPPFDDSRLTLTISKNQPLYDQQIAFDFVDYVNKDTFFGFSPGKVKCSNITGHSQYERGVFYWKNTYTFHIRNDGWDYVTVDMGTHELKSGHLYAITENSMGLPVTGSQLLDGNGRKAALDMNNLPIAVKLPPFKPYLTAKFALLDLP